jgi:hypothetical protein
VATLSTGVLNIPDYTGSAAVAYHQVTSASYAASAGDRTIGVNYAGAVAITLASAASVPAGAVVVVKDESGNAGTNNITISPSIDGVTQVLKVGYDVRRMYSNGTNWFLE